MPKKIEGIGVPSISVQYLLDGGDFQNISKILTFLTEILKNLTE